MFLILCLNPTHPNHKTGTWVMVAVTGVLLLLAAAGSGLDLMRKKETGRQKKGQGQSSVSRVSL